ncbi:MAG: pilus assembly protein PilY [Burkholderiales bacterium]|nr:pilus assembly protein PilY [Burkholderiales bacterium]
MNRLSKQLRAVLLLAMAGFMIPAWAEDIDIYSGANSGGALPNVLVILDNSANWSSSTSAASCFYKENGVVTAAGPKTSSPDKEQGTKMGIEKCALYNLIDALPVRPGASDPSNNALFNVGIMLLNESPGNGAYPRRAFTALTTNNKAALKALISALSIEADRATNGDFAKAMYEAYLYFKGATPYQGTQGGKWDHAAVSGGKYVSPSQASCARNHVIFIANGSPQSSENGSAQTLLADAGGDTSQITYATSYVKSVDQANWADEFSRFMRGIDVSGKDGAQGIVTHGLAVTGDPSDGLYPNFIQAIATASGGTFHSAGSADSLLDSLLVVFNEIQAVNSVFAAASLPVAVNARGTYLNQIYMGMFRPDADAHPRWRGNLKQYHFALDNLGLLQLVDSNGAAAVSSTTGFISTSATSAWTAGSTFWSNQPLGTPASASDSPDGEVVEKGAAAQRLRTVYATSQASRKVLTCVGCSPNTVLGGTGSTEFKAANALVTDASLGVATSGRADLIDWLRGTSNAGDEAGPTTSPATTIRPSVHGDVLHSRSAVVNYGGSRGVVVFYGANDGMLHAINGNPSGAGAGDELWGFIPQEMFPKLNRLRANYPTVRLSTTASTTATPRGYFVDGPIGVYQKVNADQTMSRVIIYIGMRRGGRLLYAFDVTDPEAPQYLWKKTSSDLAQLGQTWSEPKVARILGNANPVLVFGAGYDADAEDIGTPGATTMGNRVYVLDAISGVLLKAFSTERSVAADVALVDADLNGQIDRAYAVDLGGKVYRIDFETSTSTAPSAWSIDTIADLSGGTSTGRKFFFAPDVVVTRSFAALMFGSGDREKPLLNATRDHFFQIFDTYRGKGAPANPVVTVWNDLTAASSASSIAGRGCYVALEPGEKVVNAATSIAGASYFGTNRPSSAVTSGNVCTADLGVAKTYAMPDGPTSRLLHRVPELQAIGPRGFPRESGHQRAAQPDLLVSGNESVRTWPGTSSRFGGAGRDAMQGAPSAVWRATQVRSNAAARPPSPPKRELVPGHVLSLQQAWDAVPRPRLPWSSSPARRLRARLSGCRLPHRMPVLDVHHIPRLEP